MNIQLQMFHADGSLGFIKDWFHPLSVPCSATAACYPAATSIAASPDGFIYLAGSTSQSLDAAQSFAHFMDAGAHVDMFLVKLDSAGHRQWVR